jgi:transcriptional regulator with XRE-family HTH domain
MKRITDRKTCTRKLKDHPVYLLRKKKNITQSDMAFDLGVAQSTIAKIENGDLPNIDIRIVKGLRNIYKINVNKLLDEGRL